MIVPRIPKHRILLDRQFKTAQQIWLALPAPAIADSEYVCYQRDRPVCFAFVFSHAFETEVSLWMGNSSLQARRKVTLAADAFHTPKLLDLSGVGGGNRPALESIR